MRDFRKRRYILAFVITVAIFFLGFFFGFVMDLKRVDYFTSLNEKQKLDIRSIQMQYDLVKSAATENQCSAFRFVFDKAVIELEDNRERLELYTMESKVKKDDFDMLRREYILSQINFWQISEQLKKTCPESSDFVTIIYFFSDSDKCKSCDNQASVLNYYKAQLKENLLVFAIDETFEDKEPVISVLKRTYNITEYPTLIIEGKKYSGFVDKEFINGLLCKTYPDATIQSFTEEDAISCS
jgi:thiol-disulfide isomerase/thioredoxin